MPQPTYKTKLREEFHILLKVLLTLLDKLGVGSGGRYIPESSVYEKFLEAGCPDWSYLYSSKPDPSNIQNAMYSNNILKKNTDPELLNDSLGACKVAEEIIDLVPELTSDGKQKSLGIRDQYSLEDSLSFLLGQLEFLSEALFRETGDQLLTKAKSGDREAILKLIKLDKNFIHEEWSAIELRKAQLKGDDKYLKDLGKAISADPFNPDENFPKLNCFLVKGWDLGLNQLTNREIYEYVKDLGLILLSKSGHKESDKYNHFGRCSLWERSAISIRRSIKLKQSV